MFREQQSTLKVKIRLQASPEFPFLQPLLKFIRSYKRTLFLSHLHPKPFSDHKRRMGDTTLLSGDSIS
jgi:hypothetical protein